MAVTKVTAKKRGRPAGTRTKHVQTVESVTAEWHKRYNEMLEYYDGILAKGDEQYDAMRLKVYNLEHQAIGYRSVISYLENKIEQLIANSVRGN